VREQTLYAVRPDPLTRLTRALPADEALGVRLVALARAAAAVHMHAIAEDARAALIGPAPAGVAHPEPRVELDLARSQAAGLFRSPLAEVLP
jgi:hypothetical protein